jgi:nucleoside-diphosphate-sugar epimerase
VLVLGGSWFVGTSVVDQAVRAWNEVTVFNRGRTPARYPDGVRLMHGDRQDPDSLTRLAGHGPWEAVIDVAGSVPATVQ